MQNKGDPWVDVGPHRSSVSIDDQLREENRRRQAIRVDPGDLAWFNSVIEQLHLISMNDLAKQARQVALGDLDAEMQILFLNSGLSEFLDLQATS